VLSLVFQVPEAFVCFGVLGCHFPMEKDGVPHGARLTDLKK
jgi:hypothetical protein